MELCKAGNNGKGWILYGAVNGDVRTWFERWFASDEKAFAYAARKGWTVQVKE